MFHRIGPLVVPALVGLSLLLGVGSMQWRFEYFDRLYDFLQPGQLLAGRANDFLQRFWDEARPDTFHVG